MRMLILGWIVLAAGPAPGYAELISVGPSPNADLVKAACSNPSAERCRLAKEALANQVVDDLLIIGNRRNRQYRPLVKSAASLSYPSVRAAAAAALGAMGPDASDSSLLLTLLNDPVPAVRHAALRALEATNDPDAHWIAQRAKPEQGDSLASDPVPDAKQIGAPAYPGATFLYFASDLTGGEAAFSTKDQPDSVIQRIGKPAQSLSTPELQRLARLYNNKALYGGTKFIVLDEGKPEPRIAVVFEDRVLGKSTIAQATWGRTGIVFHFPAPSSDSDAH